MELELKLKEYILNKFKTLKQFAKITNLPYNTLDGILRRGLGNSNVDNVIKICNALDISTDELAEGKIVPREHLNSQNQFRDITLEINLLFNSERNYILDGKELNINEKETIN